MSTDLELDLRRALGAADGIVRAPERDLAAGAMRRHRRRRVARIGAASAAVLAVAAATAGVYTAGRNGAAPDVGASATATTPPPEPPVQRLYPDTAAPIEQVWGYALRTLPGRLPNGSDYNVLEEVSPGTFVVQATTGFERYGSVYRYRPDTATLTMLIDAAALNPSTTRIGPMGRAWVIDRHYVAAQTLEPESEPSLVEVVAVADGSQVARVTMPPGIEAGIMSWAEGHLIWTPRAGSEDAVYSSENPVVTIAGSEGYHLIGQGAWAVNDVAGSTRWWNLATGERHEAPAGPVAMPCYGTSCLISRSTIAIGNMAIVDFDGWFAGAVLERVDNMSLAPWGDHFVVVRYGEAGDRNAQWLLWDLVEGRYAEIPVASTPMETVGSNMNILILRSSATEKLVVNLTAIS
jgi:hypothetical protein